MATTTASAGITRADRITLGVFAAVAALIGLAVLIGGVLRLRLYLVAAGEGGAPLSLVTDAPLPGIPTEGDPRIVFGSYPTADLLVDGLDGGTRALLAIGEGLGALVAVVVAAALAWMFLSLARGRPFAKALYVLSLVAGATLALGSLLGQGIAGFGRMNAALQLNDAGDDLFLVGFTFDPVPLVVGFAIMAFAYVFRAGARLQRDTAGLV